MSNTIIQLRHSYVTGNVPSSLANGEIAINTYDGKLFYRGGASNTIQTIEKYEGPAGLDGEIQFNDSGVLGSNSGLTFNKTTGVFTAPIVASSNNGQGTNFKVGDDAWIGDINSADTIRIKGQQNSANAFIIFGDADSKKLGRAGTGALNYDGNFTANGEISSLQSSGDEGGQINLALAATNTTLSGSIAIDIYQNKFRIFETGGTNRGVFIDMANGAAGGVGTNLLAPSSSTDGWARGQANAAFIAANSAGVYANSAFAAANAATATDTTQNNSITAAFTAANSAGVYANGAFAAANAATATDTTQNNSITASFTAANSAGVYANGAFAKANNEGGVNLTQNNSITAAFTRANNSLDANNGGTVTGTITATSFITSGSFGDITGANTIYANNFIANTGFIQFSDGTKQYTANAGSGGGSSNSFATISNTATAIVANTSNTRLTIVGESGIVVAMNTIINQITVAAQPGAQGLTVDYGFVADPTYYGFDYGTL